ncbi:MAG TPA: ABC transporter substrate-binding protein [Steroidobacteraceae bacterium]|nr:ABC transporter substrate-binding protein [Steroidobacteraceae bacterium]
MKQADGCNARREKLRVAAFTSARIERIVALKPDLALGFSDLQADITAELIRAGIEEILAFIRLLGGLVEAAARADALVAALQHGLDRARQAAPAMRHGRLSEIKSCDILQPGPAALIDGLKQLQRIIGHCAQHTPG